MKSWYRTEIIVHFTDFNSRLITAMVATHGVYKRQNTMKAYAFNAPKPYPDKTSISPFIPAVELMLAIPNNTEKLEGVDVCQ